MLLPEQFDTDTDLPVFLLPVENLQISGLDVGPVEIPVTYDSDWRLLLHLGDVLPTEGIDRVDYWSEAPSSIKLKGADNVEINVIKFQLGAKGVKPIVEARLTREPLVVKRSEAAQGFRAVLLSAPKFINRQIILQDAASTEFELRLLKDSGHGAAHLSSNLRLTADKPLQPLSELFDFFTFVKGGHCGIGNLTANCKDESVAFQLFGFMRNDTFPKKTNWFDIEIQKDLPEIFLRFSEARRNEIARRALSQAINYYRASNASRDVSIEMAIIAAHGGLEAIVNHILETRAGWSAKLLDERSIAFSDKMRAASAHFGLYGDILLHSPEISALALARDRMDVFGLISFIRNKLVHQDPKFIPTGRQLIETWSVTQWLLEVLIFGVIGYRGKIIDRRIYRGWRGQTCDIPLRS